MSGGLVVEWRHLTPQGVPTKINKVANADPDEAIRKIAELLNGGTAAWVYAARRDVTFKGQTAEERDALTEKVKL